MRFDFKESNQEARYYERLSLGKNDSLQVKVELDLKKYKIKNGGAIELQINDLLGVQVESVIIIERMQLDYQNPPPSLLFLKEVLAYKEFCQYAIIRDMKGQYHYLRGACENDLMGFSSNYDKFYFELNFPIEKLIGKGMVIVTRDTTNGTEYSIEPKFHKNFEI
jgi:hypothetical protein